MNVEPFVTKLLIATPEFALVIAKKEDAEELVVEPNVRTTMIAFPTRVPARFAIKSSWNELTDFQVCRLGKCVAEGECGSYCLTSLDCYGGACVNNCVNWRCTEKN